MRTAKVEGALVMAFFFGIFEYTLTLRDSVFKFSFVFFTVRSYHSSSNESPFFEVPFDDLSIFVGDLGFTINLTLLPVLRVNFSIARILIGTLAFLEPIHEAAFIYHLVPESQLLFRPMVDPVEEGSLVIFFGCLRVLELDPPGYEFVQLEGTHESEVLMI